MVHLGQRTTVAANLFIFFVGQIAVRLVLLHGSSIGLCLGRHDSVQPSALRDIAPSIDPVIGSTGT